jgi:hypothetical protein
MQALANKLLTIFEECSWALINYDTIARPHVTIDLIRYNLGCNNEDFVCRQGPKNFFS